MPAIDHIRKELKCLLPDYQTVEDFLNGPTAVRAAGTRYLPMPDAYVEGESAGKREKKRLRYEAYKTRAAFYDVVAKTLGTMIGQVFAKEPAISMPPLMDVLKGDIDHGGTSIEQQAKKALWYTLGFGRGGLMADYPDATPLQTPVATAEGEAPQEPVITLKDLQEQDLRPKIVLYNHKQIINWRVKAFGGRTLPTLVVLAEESVAEDDGFEEITQKVYRVLRLDDARVYSQEVWKEDAQNKAFVLESTAVPKDSKGKPFNEIPFAPIGWESNVFEPNSIPLLGIAELAAALWRNSADYQENCFQVGQTTTWFSGLTEEWVQVAMKDGVKLGAREAVLLPVGGSAGQFTADANSQVKESMDMLMKQLVDLGARLVESSGPAKTATEAGNDEAAATSVLSSAANNVSSAYLLALTWCAKFMGVELPEDEDADDALDFQLNTDFAMSRMTSQDRQVLLAEWQGGAMTWAEYRWNLRRAGLVYEDDDKAQGEIEQETQDAITKGLIADPSAPPVIPGQPAPGKTKEEAPPEAP